MAQITLDIASMKGDFTGQIAVRTNQTLNLSKDISNPPVSINNYAGSATMLPDDFSITNGTTFTINSPIAPLKSLYIGGLSTVIVGPSITLEITEGIHLEPGSLLQGGNALVIGSQAAPATAATVSGTIKTFQTISVFADFIEIAPNSVVSAVAAVAGPAPGGQRISQENGQPRAAGGAHGGSAGSEFNDLVGTPYGSFLYPSLVGSQGSTCSVVNGPSTPGGFGGGVIQIVSTGTLMVNGSLAANGQDGTSCAGGGAGGSIFLQVGTLAGNGPITANGGVAYAAAGLGGGGSGGRIAIYSHSNVFNGTLAAIGGHDPNTENLLAGPGTVYTQDISSNYKRLAIGNGGQAPNQYVTNIITSIQNTIGRFAWLTEIGVTEFDFDEIALNGYGALALNPTNVTANTSLSINIAQVTGDSTGHIAVRENQIMRIWTDFSANVRVYPGATAYFTPRLDISESSEVDVYGTLCGVQEIVVHGTLTLASEGNSCGFPAGNYNFSLVVVETNGTLLNDTTQSTNLTSIVCAFPGANVAQFQSEISFISITDPATASPQCALYNITAPAPPPTTTPTLPPTPTSLPTPAPTTPPTSPPTPAPGLCGNGVIDEGEQCDSPTSCCQNCTFATLSMICRPSRGACDVAEVCSGITDVCPDDAVQPPGFVCHEPTDTCDLQMVCGKSTSTCPIPRNLTLDECRLCGGDNTSCTAQGVCGDGYCNSQTQSESCSSCFLDCGPCPNTMTTCENGCSGHGACTNGLCVCDTGHSGPSCDSDIQPLAMAVTENGAKISLQNVVYFSVQLQAISELKADGSVVTSFPLQTQNISSSTSTISGITSWNSTISIQNGALVVLHFMETGDSSTHVTFANRTRLIQPHSIKVAIDIIGWPFGLLSNRLQLSLGIAQDASQTNPCYTSSSDANGNTVWTLVTVNRAN